MLYTQLRQAIPIFNSVPVDGIYLGTAKVDIGISYPDVGTSTLQYYIILQTRIVPDSKKLPQDRICFDQFGVNFMNEAISPALLQRAIAA